MLGGNHGYVQIIRSKWATLPEEKSPASDLGGNFTKHQELVTLNV
jgi:hypothetical protein